jgi:type IV pilus assembly protein PilF
MTRSGAAGRGSRWLAVVLCAAALAGCATGGGPARTDIPTASDQTDNQRRARIRLELAAAYFGQGRFTTALDELKQVLAIDSQMADAWDLRGLIYSELKDDALAEESFQRAIQLDAAHGSAMHNYGWFLCQRNRYPQALAQFDRALAVPRYRDLTRTLLAKGACQARAGDLDGAEKSLARSYELDPSNPATAVNLAHVLYRKGEYERARFYVGRVNADEELSNAETLWLAARIEQRLGNQAAVSSLGAQLRRRFPQSRETQAYNQGRFNE